MQPLLFWLPLGQSVYFILTGLWPILHMSSFLAVTGPKTDLWLVKTVGALICCLSLPLLLATLNHRLTPEFVLLAMLSAATLAAVDVIYVLRKVIPKIYLLDAAVELVLLVLWAFAWFQR